MPGNILPIIKEIINMEKLFGAYSQFTQKFIAVWDEYAALESELKEYQEDGEDAPKSLIEETMAYLATLENLITEGWNKFNKTPEELKKDGWNYFFTEDAILREMRYGNK